MPSIFHAALCTALLAPLAAATSEPVTANGPVPAAASGPAALEHPAEAPQGFMEAWLDEQPPSQGSERAARQDEEEGIEVSEGLRLFLGGQERIRYMRESNKAFGKSPRVNSFYLNRLLVNADLRSEDGWRVYVEAIDARITSNDRPPLGIDRNNADLRNLFFEYEAGDTTARAGRTDLKYGNQRLISPLDWSNTRRTFEGAVLSQDLDGDKLDVFITRPVNVDPRDEDSKDHSRWFSGIYSTWYGDNGEGLDAYGLALNEKHKKATANAGNLGKVDLYTVGLRAWMKDENIDAEAEAAHQFGERASDDISAQMFTARAGYTWDDSEYKPRLGVDFDWASGDDDPTTGKVRTFNQLFPLGHKWLGRLDLIGRQNIRAISPNYSMKLDDRTKLWTAVHMFKLDTKKDSLYNAGGAAVLTDPTGQAGSDVGDEWDIRIDRDTTDELMFIDQVTFGYSYFEPGRFVSSQASSRETTLLYVQLTANF